MTDARLSARGCKTEARGARCTIEGAVCDVSPELSLARLHLGLNRRLHDGQNGEAK